MLELIGNLSSSLWSIVAAMLIVGWWKQDDLSKTQENFLYGLVSKVGSAAIVTTLVFVLCNIWS